MRKEKTIAFNSILNLAKKHLSPKVFEHSMRVMQYVMANPMIPEDIHDDCIIVALAHDLLEDTNLTIGNMPLSCDATMLNALKLLTRNEKVSYDEYIKEIKHNFLLPAGQIAYWVKMADIKDHLAQRATLTDRLKEKYLEALPFLLP